MFTLKFKTDTAAFDLYPSTEVASILAEVQKQIEYHGEMEGTIRDVNGNTIGEWELNDD